MISRWCLYQEIKNIHEGLIHCNVCGWKSIVILKYHEIREEKYQWQMNTKCNWKKKKKNYNSFSMTELGLYRSRIVSSRPTHLYLLLTHLSLSLLCTICLSLSCVQEKVFRHQQRIFDDAIPLCSLYQGFNVYNGNWSVVDRRILRSMLLDCIIICREKTTDLKR